MSGITRTGTLSAATGQTLLGQGQGGRVGSLFIQFEFSGSPAADHSITLKGRTSRDGTGIDKTLLAVAFKDYQTGSNSTSAITANKSVLIDASAQDIYADVTTVTTGSVTWTATPLLG